MHGSHHGVSVLGKEESLMNRSIGILIMTHGDNKGLALPPRVAKIQTVLIPILHKIDDSKVILSKLVDIEKDLAKAGIRTKVDDRVN